MNEEERESYVNKVVIFKLENLLADTELVPFIFVYSQQVRIFLNTLLPCGTRGAHWSWKPTLTIRQSSRKLSRDEQLGIVCRDLPKVHLT